MVIVLKDKWLWDSWYARDGRDLARLLLQADTSLKDPRLRHAMSRSVMRSPATL